MSEIIYMLCQGQPEVALSLIKTSHATHVNVCKAGQTALHLAIQKNYLDIAKALLEKQANINAPGHDPAYSHMTPLHYAALTNNLAATRLLLAWGADTALKNGHSHTAATVAKQQGFKKIAQLIEQQERYRQCFLPLHTDNVIDFVAYRKKRSPLKPV